MTDTFIQHSGHSLLGIYLNDHLAGATGGVQLARRLARAHRDSADGDTLRRLAAEIAQDRAALLGVMAVLSIPVRGYKVFAAVIGEKTARLKLNGYLTGRSPLSSLIELEMLRLGVDGKAAGWRTLRALADRDDRLDAARLDELIARAQSQDDVLEELRVRAADQIIGLDQASDRT
jgi:hypothetical protein